MFLLLVVRFSTILGLSVSSVPMSFCKMMHVTMVNVIQIKAFLFLSNKDNIGGSMEMGREHWKRDKEEQAPDYDDDICLRFWQKSKISIDKLNKLQNGDDRTEAR